MRLINIVPPFCRIVTGKIEVCSDGASSTDGAFRLGLSEPEKRERVYKMEKRVCKMQKREQVQNGEGGEQVYKMEKRGQVEQRKDNNSTWMIVFVSQRSSTCHSGSRRRCGRLEESIVRRNMIGLTGGSPGRFL
jgi:hypothetical protein